VVAYDVTKGKNVEDEQKGTKYGTLGDTGVVMDLQLLMKMKWNLSERYDLNQEFVEPVMPMHDCRRLRSMEWSMVSKAALRSRRRRMLSEPLIGCCDEF
jgi:hypothetical protein